MLLKTIFDRSMALIGLLLLWPVMLGTGLLIAWRMPGAPVLFRQQRVGRHGRLFTLVKFRTMTPSHSGSSVSVAGESRITPLGATLRRLKLDELPELWNVLRGDMSFVGPRPDVASVRASAATLTTPCTARAWTWATATSPPAAAKCPTPSATARATPPSPTPSLL